ncbi:MAG: hypothetical protein IPP90_17470 [Gemmatimonadaceae bacterium]|nr:hypothetical protein [Gemmatimonadaceae bacterium]
MTMHRMRRTLAVAVLVAGTAFNSISAQGGPPPVDRPRGGMPRAGMRGNDPRLSDEQRQQVERRLQARIDQVVRQRLALTDEQFARMREVASRIEDDRRALRTDEMSTRFAMRQELLAGDRANEKRVAELLDDMTRLERRRIELQEREQRDLAKFLSATQRARYIGLQDELRRSMQELQRRRLDPDSSGAALVRPGVRRLQRPPG